MKTEQSRQDDSIRTRGGIQSVDIALSLLQVLASFGRPASLTEIAQKAALPVSKAHRYLASFVAARFVTQAERSGRYAVGKTAISVGLSGIAQLSYVTLAAEVLPDLVERTGAMAFLSIWGELGPTVVRTERSASFVVGAIGLGSIFPLLTSATGRTFLAFSPRAVTARLLKDEIDKIAKIKLGLPDLDDLEPEDIDRLIDRIRASGHARIGGHFIPGLYSISSPLLNWQGEAEAAVTLASVDPAILDEATGAVELLMKTCADVVPQGRM